ncbi:4_t:CDS:1, partial [Dentiscutata heterogama]
QHNIRSCKIWSRRLKADAHLVSAIKVSAITRLYIYLFQMTKSSEDGYEQELAWFLFLELIRLKDFFNSNI